MSNKILKKGHVIKVADTVLYKKSKSNKLRKANKSSRYSHYNIIYDYLPNEDLYRVKTLSSLYHIRNINDKNYNIIGQKTAKDINKDGRLILPGHFKDDKIVSTVVLEDRFIKSEDVNSRNKKNDKKIDVNKKVDKIESLIKLIK